MKKRFLISLMAAVLLLPAGIIATAAPAADSGSAANGICRAACAYAQNCSSGANQNNYVDEDNDGVCDNRQDNAQATVAVTKESNYVDEDNDGVCDNRQEGTCANAGDANRYRERNGGGQGNNSNASNGRNNCNASRCSNNK